MAHGLLDILRAAAAGRPPAADGSVELLPPLDGPADAVVTFTAHSYVVADVDERRVRARLRPDDPGAATHAAFIAWLAEHLGCQGLGRALALSARHLAPAGEPVFVQVSPGNAASLRAVLAAGYRPIGSEVLLPRRR